jgi:heterodisulfide reductase subunit A
MAKERHESRVGTFLCQCGDEIAPRVDLAKLRERLERALPDVPVHVSRYWCSPSGRRRLAELAEKHGLDAVVVAGCSERTLGPLMVEAAGRAGINRNRTVLVNLLDHCARVHRVSKPLATSKALRMVLSGVERARHAECVDTVSADVNRSTVVIGGGVTGMTAARSLAARGAPVTLVERSASLGGILRDVNKLYPSYGDAAEYVEQLAESVEATPGIAVLTDSRVVSVAGHAGEYTLAVETAGKTRELVAGCVVVATGAAVLEPHGLYDYGSNDRVVTQLEFESMLREGLGEARRIVMIQCVGSRNEERPYCSRVCCTATVKNTITVHEQAPGAEITVLTRGFAQYVGDLDRARSAGVEFVRFDPERPPVVRSESVDVWDEIASKEVSIPYDLVVLATPLVAHADAPELSELLGVPHDQYGFIAEPHTKLRPGRFAPRGIFVAGAAHWPATVTECQSQAYSAAARAVELIERGTIERQSDVARVDELTCRGCGRCDEACAHDAIGLSEGDDGIKTAEVDTVRCVGCGVCVQVCPSSAMRLVRLTQDQLLAAVGASVR